MLAQTSFADNNNNNNNITIQRKGDDVMVRNKNHRKNLAIGVFIFTRPQSVYIHNFNVRV